MPLTCDFIFCSYICHRDHLLGFVCCPFYILHPFCTWTWPQTTALQVRSTTEVLEDWCPSSTVGRQDQHWAKERHTRGLPYSVAALAEQQPTDRNHTCTVFPCTVVAGVGLSFMSILHKKHCRIPLLKKETRHNCSSNFAEGSCGFQNFWTPIKQFVDCGLRCMKLAFPLRALALMSHCLYSHERMVWNFPLLFTVALTQALLETSPFRLQSSSPSLEDCESLHLLCGNCLQFSAYSKDKAEQSLVYIFEVFLLTCGLDTYFQKNALPNTNTLKICTCEMIMNNRTLISTTQTFRKKEKKRKEKKENALISKSSLPSAIWKMESCR